MADIIDKAGNINYGLVAHVQSASVNKVVQAASIAPELAQAFIEVNANAAVQKEAGQVAKTISSQLLSSVDEENENKEEMSMFQQNQNSSGDAAQQEEEQLIPDSPFVGNLLNLKI